MQELQEKLGSEKIFLDWVYDQRPYIRSAISLVRQNILLGGTLAVMVLLIFFRSFPSELEEAAAIDGCSPFSTFVKIVLPISSPGLITVTIFNFIGIWNEYLLALVLLRSEDKRPLSLGLYALQSSIFS